jgi:hypothetical protein
MTVPWVAAGDEYAVRPIHQSLHDEQGIDPTGARDPDDAQVGRLLEARHTSGIGATIGAPVTQKTDYPQLLGSWFVPFF